MDFIIKKLKEKKSPLVFLKKKKRNIKQLTFTWNKVGESLKKVSFIHLFFVVVAAATLFPGRRRRLIRHECNQQKLRKGPYIIT